MALFELVAADTPLVRLALHEKGDVLFTGRLVLGRRFQ